MNIFFLIAIVCVLGGILDNLIKVAQVMDETYNYLQLYNQAYVLLKKKKNVRYFKKKVLVLKKKNIEVSCSMEVALEMHNRAVKLLSQYDELKVINLFGLCKQEIKELKNIEKEVSLWIQSIGIEN